MGVDVLVIGKFTVGKTTFLNALTGEDMSLGGPSVHVTTLTYGNDDKNVRVFKQKSNTPVIVPRDKFSREFQISSKALDYLYENEDYPGTVDEISYIEMQTANPLFPGGVRIIDTPSLNFEKLFTILTEEYVPKANAIIFMLNATALFSKKEKEYIEKNFGGKHLQNVFFVVNRINQIFEPLEENVKPTVRSGLSSVFTDASGKFDEILFQKRVFYVDAYGALCARTGEPYKVLAGRKEIEFPIEIEETGFLEFESALWQYLRSSVGYGRK